MAKANLNLIRAIRNTAEKLENGAPYQWGHMGSCNCGNLAQEITRFSKGQIHEYAMQRYGDWNEQLNDYCPQSGLHMDQLVTCMLDAGLDIDDLKHLERLSDPRVLKKINSVKEMRHNYKPHVIKYLKTWANSLEEELVNQIDLPEWQTIDQVEIEEVKHS